MNAQDTLAAIAAPLPASAVSTKSLKGSRIDFITWHDACALMDLRAPGWSYEVREVGHIKGLVFMTVRVTIPTDDGLIYRDATGNENDETSGYGDPFSNAESMALRRAFVKFGLARELYKGKIAGGSPAPGSSNGHDAPAPTSNMATDKQIRAIFGKLKDKMGAEYTTERGRQLLTMKTGIESASQMTRGHADVMFKWLDSDQVEADIGRMLAAIEQIAAD